MSLTESQDINIKISQEMEDIPTAKQLRAKYESKVKGVTIEQYKIMQKDIKKLEKAMQNHKEFCGFVAVAEDHNTYTPAMINYLDSLGYKVALTTHESAMSDTTYYYTDLSFKEDSE